MLTRLRNHPFVSVATCVAALVAAALMLGGATPLPADAQPSMPDIEDRYHVTPSIFVEALPTSGRLDLTFHVEPSHEDCWIDDRHRAGRRLRIQHGLTDASSLDVAKFQEGSNTPCTYTIHWPANEDGPWARWERAQAMFVRPGNRYVWSNFVGDTTTTFGVANAREEFRADYRLAQISRFEPQITIEVPDEQDPSNAAVNKYSGASFTVNFARTPSSPMECTGTDSATYVVGDGSNTAEPMGDLPLLVYDPDTDDDTNMLCSYMVTFPDSVSDTLSAGATANLWNQGLMTATISDIASVTREYSEDQPLDTFTPDITITVPDYPSDSDGGLNYHNGAAFTVSFSPASATPVGCSDIDHVYEVGMTATAVPEGGVRLS